MIILIVAITSPVGKVALHLLAKLSNNTPSNFVHLNTGLPLSTAGEQLWYIVKVDVMKVREHQALKSGML
jgi:hypothetical protein